MRPRQVSILNHLIWGDPETEKYNYQLVGLGEQILSIEQGLEEFNFDQQARNVLLKTLTDLEKHFDHIYIKTKGGTDND